MLLTWITAPIGLSSAPKQLAENRLAYHRNQGCVIAVLLRNASSCQDLPIGDRRIVGADALNVRRPVLISVLDLSHLADEIADAADRRSFAAERVCVHDGESRCTSLRNEEGRI